MSEPRIGIARRPLCLRCADGGVPRACCRAVFHSRCVTPRSNHAITKVSLHRDVYRKPVPPDGALLARTIAVLAQMCRLHSTYYGVARLRLKALGLHDAHQERNLRANWPRVIERELQPVVTSAVEALEVVVLDFVTVEHVSVDYAGDFLAGFLDDVNGTLKTVMLLLMLITGRGDVQNITKDMLDSVSWWRNRRFMHSPELDNILRGEVDRLVPEIEQCGLPMLHFLDIRDCVRRDLGVPEIMRSVLAIQACAEAGYEALGDKWIREITCQLSSTPRGTVITPTPTSRTLALALMGRLLLINGTPVAGLPTGDRWFAQSEVEYCGGDARARVTIISDLSFSGRHMVRQPLSRGTIRTVPRWLTRLLIKFIRGEHAALNNSYVELMEARARGEAAEGEASALAWERLIAHIEKDEGLRHASVIRRTVNMRALVGFVTHAHTATEYSTLFAQRLIASLEMTQVNMRGPRWEMLIKTDEAGRIVTQITGRDMPADLLAVVNTTIEELEARDNANAIPSNALGTTMAYAWPIQRTFLKTHETWGGVAPTQLTPKERSFPFSPR